MSLSNERRAELDQAQSTVTKEHGFLQKTPLGDSLIVYYQAPDLEKVHVALAVSEESFGVWFRAQVLDITGINISTPKPGLPKPILDWSRR